MSIPLEMLRNNTDTIQSFGRYTIPPRGIGRVPLQVIEGFRAHPNASFTVIADEPEVYFFAQTDHLPDNPRYRARRHES